MLLACVPRLGHGAPAGSADTDGPRCRCRNFEEYSDLLGLDVLMNLGWVATLGTSGGGQFSVMDIDQSAPCDPQPPVEVSDVDRAYQRALSRGAEILHPPQDDKWGVRRGTRRGPAPRPSKPPPAR